MNINVDSNSLNSDLNNSPVMPD